jgi:hypothetical protein
MAVSNQASALPPRLPRGASNVVRQAAERHRIYREQVVVELRDIVVPERPDRRAPLVAFTIVSTVVLGLGLVADTSPVSNAGTTFAAC